MLAELAVATTSKPIDRDVLAARVAIALVVVVVFRRNTRGWTFMRADAVRSLLTRALDQIEGTSAPTKRGGR